MKILLVLLCVFSAYVSTAKNFYVAANGSDANNGTSSATPWQTIKKLNASFASIVAGDSILFRSGDTFYGAIVVTKSGSTSKPIVFSSYGTGAQPVISGLVSVSNWVSVGNGIYQAHLPGAKSTLNMVLLNGRPQELGRYPNSDAANGGYFNYESYSGSTSITDNQLTSTVNWTGAKVVVRKKLWILDRGNITAHSGGRLTFTNIGSSNEGSNGYGYFFQDDVRTLDKLGEWYLNKSTKYLQMYFGAANPSAYAVKASCIDTLINLSSRSYININGLTFEGANDNALFSSSGNYVNIQDCNFINSGVGAISGRSTSNFLIENCNINFSLSNAIVANSIKSTNVTIRGCKIDNTGTLPGMGQGGGNSYKGIMAGVLSNLLIEYNNVDTTGYVGIDWQGNNVTVRYNVVDYFDFIKDDAGGIYTYTSGTDANPGTVYTNRTVTRNIVMNGVGAPYGRSSSSAFVSGIYLDGRTMNVNVIDNTIFNMGKNGIHTNNPQSVIIRGNTSYNNLNAVSCARWAIFGNIRNFTISNNILYSKLHSQRSIYYVNTGLNEPAATTTNAALRSFATIDSNIYSKMNEAGFQSEIYSTTGGAIVATSPYSLDGWKANTGHDDNGKNVTKHPVSYKITGLVGNNRFSNGLFNTTSSGFSVYGTTSTGSWDNTGKISGGSLKISVSTPGANKYTSLIASLGAVSAAKKYVLRFSTYGTTSQGIARAYIRKTASPYTSLVPTQVKSFGIGRKDHEVLFDAPTTEAGSSFVIEIEQTSGTTYIDNVEFYEATANVLDVEDQIRFEYNATKQPKTISLDANYTGVTGTVYSGSITLQPFTSIILTKDTATVVAPPPPAPTGLKATGTAAPISCYGSSTTVSVSASGGTAPYTGTGTFNASAGKGSVKLSFPTSRTGSYASMYYAVGAVSSAKNYVLRFSTLGTSGTGSLRVGIRQTYTPWGTITARQTTTFGTTRKDHEFVFIAPPTQTAASFLIEIEQSSGTTYIDNIAFFECDTAGKILGADLYSYGQFETGISRVFVYSGNGNHTASWDTTGKIASTYYYPVRDAANDYTMVPVTVSQPSAPLVVNAVAGVINVAGGTTSVQVNATGGTAPYTGHGTINALEAGTYNYTVTDAMGCSASATVTVLPYVAARPSAVSAAASQRINNAADAETSDKQLQLSAYPNPFSNSMSLQVKSASNEKVLITVYSIDSKQVYQTAGSSNQTYKLGNNLMAGVYFVKVIQGANVQTVKVIKTTN